MKKFFKWAGIVAASLIILIILFLVYLFISHDRYQFRYDSGGKLSTVQAKMDIISYDIALEIFPDDQALAGTVTVSLRSDGDGLETIELDLIDNYAVSAVTSDDGKNLEFEHDDGKLMIKSGKQISKIRPVSVAISYSGQPLEAIYPPWLGGFNWSLDSTGAYWIGLSCQSEGGDIWFPCKDHQSDKPDSVNLHITIPEPYYCAANGLLNRTTIPRPGYLTYHWVTHYPISNYNINISIGRYEILERLYETESATVMPVRYYVLPEARNGAGEHLEMAVDMLKTYRKYFGEYPFIREKFAIVQTDYLGMEHQTINAYGNEYKYREIDGFQFDQLMLHEMGHEWWGNKVTARDLADMWIQEGICTYGEALYIEDKLGTEAYHQYINQIKRRIINRNPIIPKREASENEVYQSDIYTKGAQLIHSLRFLLGDQKFFELIRTFATDSAYTYQNLVSTEDFVSLVGRYADTDYREYIETFLYTTDLIHVKIDSVDAETYQVSLPNIGFRLPMEVALGDSVIRTELGSESRIFQSREKPRVDPNRWYLVTVLRSEK